MLANKSSALALAGGFQAECGYVDVGGVFGADGGSNADASVAPAAVVGKDAGGAADLRMGRGEGHD